MLIFDEPNISGGWVCPICKTNNIKPVTLIPREETIKGHTAKAEQVHVDCLSLILYRNGPVSFIAQDIREDSLK